MAYVGDTRSRRLLAKLKRHGVGQMIVRGRLRGRRLDRWAYDNGAFEDWRQGRAFDGERFVADLRAAQAEPRPDFVVLPDRVADAESLRFSLDWLDRLRRLGLDAVAPPYLAVQDGMVANGLPWGDVAGVFIGGTLDWKRRTAASWAEAARAHDVACHYARCGTARRIAHAKAIGCDSLDSSLPLWSDANCAVFLGALAQEGWPW
jgi:hypothetical protein